MLPRYTSFAWADEIPRLAQLREEWLDSPNPEFHGRTPRSIIERERARLPEAVSGHDAMVDPDCPCCQMMAEMSGPTFWHLDGSGMDWDFAFDIYHPSRDAWEAERREWDECSRRFDAEWTEREQLGVTHQGPEEDGSPSIWMRSFSSEDGGELPLGVRVFGIGCRLAELIVGLRGGASREATALEAQARIDQLNRDFANLREILRSDDVSLSEALLDPALDRCVETLAGVASDCKGLAEQCESISEAFRNLFAPPPPTPDWGPEDLDIPF